MFKNIARVISYDLITKALIGVSSLAVIRYMPPGEYAVFTLALSVIALLSNTFGPAFNRIYIIGYDRLGIKDQLSPFLGLQYLVCLGTGLVLIPFFSFSTSLWIALLALGLANVSLQFIRSVFQQFLNFNRFGQFELVRGLLFALGVGVAIYVWRQNLRAAEILLIQFASVCLAVFPALISKSMFRRIFDFRSIKNLIKLIGKSSYKYLVGYHVVVAVYGQIDILMLQDLTSAFTLATYGSAFRYYALFAMALSAVQTVLLPTLGKLKYKEDIGRIYKKHFKLVVLFVPIVGFGMAISPFIIPWIDGGKYALAIPVFQILAVSSIFSFAFSPHVTLLLKYEKFRYLFGQIILATVFNVLLNIYLIPIWGAIGAALATLVGYGMINIGTYIKSRKIYRELPAGPENS